MCSHFFVVCTFDAWRSVLFVCSVSYVLLWCSFGLLVRLFFWFFLPLGSFVGYPSGETNFLLLISSPQRITVTTCSETTDFDTWVH